MRHSYGSPDSAAVLVAVIAWRCNVMGCFRILYSPPPPGSPASCRVWSPWHRSGTWYEELRLLCINSEIAKKSVRRGKERCAPFYSSSTRQSYVGHHHVHSATRQDTIPRLVEFRVHTAFHVRPIHGFRFLLPVIRLQYSSESVL